MRFIKSKIIAITCLILGPSSYFYFYLKWLFFFFYCFIFIFGYTYMWWNDDHIPTYSPFPLRLPHPSPPGGHRAPGKLPSLRPRSPRGSCFVLGPGYMSVLLSQSGPPSPSPSRPTSVLSTFASVPALFVSFKHILGLDNILQLVKYTY